MRACVSMCVGDEHQLGHPEEGAADNILPPAAEEAWPTA